MTRLWRWIAAWAWLGHDRGRVEMTKGGGKMTTFNDEQQTKLIEFLEAQQAAGLTLTDVIEGLTYGTLTTPATDRNASFAE